MAKLELYQVTTPSMNPSGITKLLPGGAGVQVAGSSTNPGISSPSLESWQRDVIDETVTSLLVGSTTPGTPAPVGKLLVLDPINAAFGAYWKLNSVKLQPLGAGQYGIVTEAGDTSSEPNNYGQTSAAGNVARPGLRARVIMQGPAQAFVQGTVGNTAISAGMPLAADGAGNLTYAGASPAAGTVLGTYADATMLSTVSVPVLSNCYMGGY